MKRSIRNTWAILTKEERRSFLLHTILGLIIAILDILFLASLLWIINFYLQAPTTGSFLPSWAADNRSVGLIAAFLFLFCIKNLLAYSVTRMQNRFIGGVAIRISGENLSSYQRAHFDIFNDIDSSVHLRRICFQPFEFAQYMLAGIQQVILQGFLILLALAAITWFNPQVFLLLLLILLPPVAIIFYFIRKKLGGMKQEIQKSNERSFRYLLDALKGFVEGNIFNRNEFFHRRFLTHRRQFSNHLFNSQSLQVLPSRLIEVFAVLGLFLLLVIANWRESGDHQSTLVTIAAFMAAAYKIIPGLVRIINISGQVKAYDFEPAELLTRSSGNEPAPPADASSAIESIHIENLDFNYGKKAVLEDFCLSLERGQLVGLSGTSGRGKTTIMHLILGFLHPQGGAVRINSTAIRNGEAKQFWPAISYVRQQPFLIHDTVLRNITFEESSHDEERLQWALALSGIDKIVESWPGGLQAEIMEDGRNISGGQGQRIALARALYKRADVLLLDEPFNELDQASTQEMMTSLRQIVRSGKIILLITHQEDVLHQCDKIIRLDE